ncbi:RagB/SusD family nutrient uptake outer membrane protein [Sphingobacterium yanglingense]|uniref:Putative outer membrane starch-binding protein n=1 Tax=Sphingobacterium yanglingense TaxID=1437280 RepID=A0A4V3DDZ4_9SPHI|nr:RagB/SusD family nutrient uptake outer membrane protein [Sphingobacterium yanglingense]TDQ77918.1 putative outer membrane starch-binding protein [Sphingobacterium yanglingense]
MKNTFLYKSFKFYGGVFLGCLTCFSCREWIELPPSIDKIPTEIVFTDSTSAITALAGVYANFGYYGGGSSSINGALISLYPALSSDELLASSTGIDVKQFEENSLRPNNFLVSTLWRTGYEGIYRINACIKGITESKGLNEGLKERLIAEVKVARALYYFNLVNLYGGVPLVTTTDYSISAKQPRANVDEIYTQIIGDLTDARKILKETYPSAGRARPNLYVATALMARVYLYQKNWTAAEAMAREVINAKTYSLQMDLSKVFLSASTEAIWQLPTAGTSSGQTSEASTFVPFSKGVIPSYYLTPTLLSAFEADDKRKASWIKVDTIKANIYHYPFKYKNIDANNSPREDYILFRLPEQYLILAEALVMQKRQDEALPYIEAIRSRAGLSAVHPTTEDEFLKVIMQERRVEFFCEQGSRWFDLKRTGTADAVLGPLKPTRWTADDALYPVALSELTANGALEQNPGYE